jgi:hypothetical protein
MPQICATPLPSFAAASRFHAVFLKNSLPLKQFAFPSSRFPNCENHSRNRIKWALLDSRMENSGMVFRGAGYFQIVLGQEFF